MIMLYVGGVGHWGGLLSKFLDINRDLSGMISAINRDQINAINAGIVRSTRVSCPVAINTASLKERQGHILWLRLRSFNLEQTRGYFLMILC